LSTTLCATADANGALAIVTVKVVNDGILASAGFFAPGFFGTGFFCTGGLFPGLFIRLVGAGGVAAADGEAMMCCPSRLRLLLGRIAYCAPSTTSSSVAAVAAALDPATVGVVDPCGEA
jgi:hypothetical protein